MKSSTKSSIRNILVSLVLVGISAFFARQFYLELTQSVENVDGVVVGEVLEIRGQVQRRYEDQSRWGSLKGNETLYNLDAIRTYSSSGAEIILLTYDDEGVSKKDTIILGQDTYIILDLLGEARNINFVGGDISASGSGGLTVSAEGTVVSVDDGSVNLSREEGRQTSVTVTEGEARVITGEGETVVGTESKILIDEGTGSTKREQVAVVPTLPKSNALLLTYGTERRVNFAWDLLAEWEKPVLEVSSNPAFSEESAPVVKQPANENAVLTLTPGVWYWRLGDESTGEKGPMNIFTVDMERPADPVSPANELTIPFRGEAPAVNLQWNRAWFADSYTVEVSRNAAFTEIQRTREITGSSLLLEELTAGSWWWRVKPNYRRGLLDTPRTPAIRQFVLEHRVGHDPVTLISPANGSELSGLDVREGIPFRWKNQEGLVSYRVLVAQDSNFSVPTADSDGPENWRLLLTAPKPATYWWKVEATSADGLPVPQSEIRSFTVKPVTGSVELVDPAPGATKELEPYSPYTFVWRSGIPGTARFQLTRFDTGNTRTKIIESLINGETFTAPIPGEGTYAWRIQILDEGGRMIVESQEARFSLRTGFSAPILRNPRPGDSISLIGSDSLILQWDPEPAADAYSVVLKAPNGSVVDRDDRVLGLEREFTVAPSSGPGSYSVELTSIRDNPPAGAARMSESRTYRFDISNLVGYSAAVPVSPAGGAFIDGLSALKNGILLRWTQNPSLGRWTVEVDNGTVTRLYQTTEPSLKLEGLDSGRYSWKIRSRDGFGREAPDSRIAVFTVGAIPNPEAPVLTSPGYGEKVDMTGAKNLVFSWNPVPNAEFYDLALYAVGSETPLFRKNDLTETTFILENLRILDVGDFKVALRARIEYEDVGMSKASSVSETPFSLSVNIGNKAPTILTDELQYAD